MTAILLLVPMFASCRDGLQHETGGAAGAGGIGGDGTGGGGAGAVTAKQLTSSAGAIHTCAVMTDGTVRCWGSNADGQLGNGSTADSSVPVAVLVAPGVPLTGVGNVATGVSHSCALLRDGTVACWGENQGTELDDGSTLPSTVAIVVKDASGQPLSGMTAIGSGDDFTCAVAQGGGVLCWGSNEYGQLGDSVPAFARSQKPVVVADATGAPLTGVTAMGVGFGHVCVVLSGGTVNCWGHNLYGQLGNHSDFGSRVPVTVASADGVPLSGMVAVSAGVFTTCAIGAAGGVSCWGLNNLNAYQDTQSGVLGDGDATLEFSTVPMTVVASAGGDPLLGATTIGVGQLHACALLRDGSIRCWGDGAYGGLGAGDTSTAVPLPVLMGDGTPLAVAGAVAAGYMSTCALMQSGMVTCWGSNMYGQLGNAGEMTQRGPVEVQFP